MASTPARLLPAEIYKSGRKLWENPVYVQDDRKTCDWNMRHAYLAQYGNKVFLLLYITRPPHGKVKEWWTLHRVAEGLAPWGFSKPDDSNKNDEDLCIGVQTKDPEGLKFIALSKESDVSEFMECVNKALGRDFMQTKLRLSRAATVPLKSNKPQDIKRANTALPRIGQKQSNTELNILSREHMREGSSPASSEVDNNSAFQYDNDPRYQGGEYLYERVLP